MRVRLVIRRLRDRPLSDRPFSSVELNGEIFSTVEITKGSLPEISNEGETRNK